MAKETSFPVLPMDAAVSRRVIRPGKVYESDSGVEERTSPWTTDRYEYTISFPVMQTAISAPSPYGSNTEPAALIRAFDDANGILLTYTFTDPFTASSVNVRFVEDSLTLSRIVPGIWKASFKLVTVL